MYLDLNETLVPVFELSDKTIETLDIESLRDNVVKCESNEPLGLELRERVTQIEFNSEGFKELATPIQIPEGLEKEDLDILGVINNNLMNYTVKRVEGDNVIVTPNFVVNIKHGKVHNVFDTIGRMKYYNFLTDIVNAKQNEWKIVTAVEREVVITKNAVYEAYFPNLSSSLNRVIVSNYKSKDGEEVQRNTLLGLEYLPLDEVYELLCENDISLAKVGITLSQLAKDYLEGRVSKEDFSTQKLKQIYRTA